MFCYICGTEINEVIVCDIVKVGDNYFYEEITSPVLYGEDLDVRAGKIFDYDFFKKAAAKKHSCMAEDVCSKYIDDMPVDSAVLEKLGKKETDLGCRCPICEDFI